ncbi:Crp/Fnr family transcriptional regulator [Zhouia spongiae]|uniref:Crp/Fnr family transcriptional regulator n=1 Tax=Zhouia spongiae TaxID=2202721 RepID=A0ABY3YJF5_9FLAO|nr:Crp/Fnr family transcriptional regulator [Zhouia spongiae]UNY97947.1 Crp/Fnr family transcriptional regulator [Zhouia spongiae]
MENDFEAYYKYFNSLRENPLLHTVDDNELNKLLHLGAIEKWPKKTCILDPERTLYKFHIIISGRLKTYKTNSINSRHITLFLLFPGAMFDILSLYDSGKHDIYYETLDDLEVLCIPVARMKAWLGNNPSLHDKLIKHLTKQVKNLENYLLAVNLESTFTRLAKLLLRHSNRKSQLIEEINDLSHNELAAMIGTTRAVINRHLQRLKEEGIIKINRKHITINNIDALIGIAQNHT